VAQDLAGHGRLEDAGDDLAAGSALAAQEVQIEGALHELGPAQAAVDAQRARRTRAGPDGPNAGGALFSGDALQAGLDRRHVSFMYSYPNLIPIRTTDVVALRERIAGYEFEDVFGYTWGRDIIGGGRAAVDASLDRFLAAVAS